ncbi:MAG: hypothetical protein LBU12_04725, partial [Deltaproteobacteria bacterium]|nr:hypothetical protein [Deltaproteobacteria bacterium]
AVTATADSVSTALGGGLALQTSYVPDYVSATDAETPDERKVHIKWVGNAFGLFVDQWGNLREDTNLNGKLDIVTGPPNAPTGDMAVRFENKAGLTNSRISLWVDEKGVNELERPSVRDSVVSIHELRSVWNASQQLAELTDAELAAPRAFGALDGRRLYAVPSPPANTAQGWSTGLKLSDHLFSQDNAAALTPLLVQGYTLAAPRKFVGPVACNEDKRLACGSDAVVCQEIHVSAVGRPPHELQSLAVEITAAVAPGTIIPVSGPGGSLTLRVGLTTAKGVVTALNDFIYDNHVPHIVRASLNSGDSGAWTPNAGSATLPTTNNAADRQETAAALIKYVTGQDIRGWRSRTVCTPWSTSTKQTWRLGDIINSRPVIVGEPAGSYDLVYGDQSYSAYKRNLPSYAASPGVMGRRMVAYFGSNDGVLHAVNLGFYGSLADGSVGYARQSAFDEPNVAHKLGSELWGFLPTSLLPHLTWMTNPDYAHSYYADLEPMIVDVKNTSANARNLGDGRTWEVGEWRTILIGGLRLGGRSVELDAPEAPTRFLYSEYFALDVTDPEEEPILLWRFSDPNLGLTVTKPAVVSAVDGWKVILASGPTSDLVQKVTTGGVTQQVMAPVGNGGQSAYKGVSTQSARLFVLNAYNGALEREFGGESNFGVPSGQSVPANSFFNDSFVPASVGPGSAQLVVRGAARGSVDWRNQAVYYGLTQSRDFNRLDKGALMRLQMVNSSGAPVPVSQWQLTTLYKTDRPVTGAVNATFDSAGNMWVVFGTGRLWSTDDVSPLCQLLTTSTLRPPCQANHVQYLYGIKEPMANGRLTFAEVVETSARKILDVTSARVFSDGSVTGYPGYSGTTRYDTILEKMKDVNVLGYKRGLNYWSYLNDGYTSDTYEMILTQPKLTAMPNGRSIMSVTTYQPSNSECDP